MRDVELDIRPGVRVAIVGRSGAGKSTLIARARRLYDVTDGHVLVDGVDVREYSLATLRAAIAVVQQDTFLFTGTLRDNITYAPRSATVERSVLERTLRLRRTRPADDLETETLHDGGRAHAPTTRRCAPVFPMNRSSAPAGSLIIAH